MVINLKRLTMLADGLDMTLREFVEAMRIGALHIVPEHGQLSVIQGPPMGPDAKHFTRIALKVSP